MSESSMSMQRTFEQNAHMSIHEVIAQMYDGNDWIFVEGFKSNDQLKIEVIRSEENSQIPLLRYDDFVVAVARPESSYSSATTALPVLPLNSPEVIADWLIANQERFIYASPLP